jgi:hypothetical protein
MQRVRDAQLWIDLNREHPSGEPVEVPRREVSEPSKALKVILCFTCQANPAGNDYAGSHSAYCADCQPGPGNPLPRGTRVSQCPLCLEVFSGEAGNVRSASCEREGYRESGHLFPERLPIPVI